jgi:hypothetical protein
MMGSLDEVDQVGRGLLEPVKLRIIVRIESAM